MVPDHIQVLPPQPDAVAELGIAGIAVVMALAGVWFFSVGDGRRRLLLAIGAAAILGMSALAANTGLLSRFDIVPPPMMVMIVLVFGSAFAFALSPWGGEVAAKLSLACLVGLQVFRWPLEMIMHHAGERGIMPVELSYSGMNFDIVTGVGAAALFIWFRFAKSVPRVRPLAMERLGIALPPRDRVHRHHLVADRASLRRRSRAHQYVGAVLPLRLAPRRPRDLCRRESCHHLAKAARAAIPKPPERLASARELTVPWIGMRRDLIG